MSRHANLIFLLSFVTFFCAASSLKLPKVFTRCHRSDPKFNECLKNSLDGALKVLSSKGLPKFGIGSIDPILIPMMTIAPGAAMAVSLEQKYKDVKTFGYREGKVEKVFFDDHNLNFTVRVPSFKLMMNYEVDGKILLINVFGKGPAEFILDQTDVEHSIKFDKVKKADDTYLEVKSYIINILPKKVMFKFDNLFDGNAQLSEAIHRVVNQNWELVFEDVVGSYNEVYATLFLHYAKSFFSKVPFNEVFPQ